MPRSVSCLATAVAALVLTACAGDAGEADVGAGADTVAASTAPAPAAGSAADTGAAMLGADDLDAYGRALEAEIAVLEDAVARRASARSQQDTIGALYAATETQTVPAAAERAGISADRYRRLDDVFGRVLGARVMNPGMGAMMADMAQSDTSFLADLPPARADSMRARMRESMGQLRAATSDSAAYAPLPPSLREEFRERAAATLDSLWRQRMELRARAAGLRS